MEVKVAFEVLGIEKTRSEKAIRDAYRTQAKTWHPDRHMAVESARLEAERQMKLVNEAVEVLLTYIARPETTAQTARPAYRTWEESRTARDYTFHTSTSMNDRRSRAQMEHYRARGTFFMSFAVTLFVATALVALTNSGLFA